MFVRLIYSALLYLLFPIIFVALQIPKKGKAPYGSRIFELFGKYHFKKDVNASGVIWFHTVSVGETIAATRLIRDFHNARPNMQIVVTTTTTAGMEQALKIGDFITHLFAPLDFPHAINSFLRKVKPQMLVIMETELWPNWLNCCSKHNVPVVLMNARMSERSCRRYSSLGGFFYKLFGQYLSLVLCQNEEDTQRYNQLGVNKITVTGSLKCDLRAPKEQILLGRKLHSFFNNRKVWIAASTHEGEDEVFIQAHLKLLEKFPDLLLILVPRHPQRFSAVAEKIAKSSLSFCKFSDPSHLDSHAQVLLGDKMGVMYQLFAASDIAVMGGSFVDVGGHNPLEPASVGIPIIMGHYYYNFKEFTIKMSNCGGLFVANDEEMLISKLQELISDENLRISSGRKALEVLEAGQGATERTLQGIFELLNDRS